MYAIIQDGGKQYAVSPGQLIQVEKKDSSPGEPVIFSQVLYYRDKDDIRIGTPNLENVKVEGTIEKQIKGTKIRIYKYRRREDSHDRKGHRQKFTEIRIAKIICS